MTSSETSTTLILVVDDEPGMKPLYELRFRKKIASGAYRLLYALSGVEALELLEQNPAVEIVLCDINMPGMDGLELLPKLMEQNPFLRVVMVSAYGDMPKIRKAMNLGAFDFVTKPIDFKDLDTTISKTIREVETARRALITKELEDKNKNLQALDQLKSRFFTNISHEFRTPLTAILGTAGQIKSDPENWVEKGVPVIERNGNRLLNLVNQVLDLRKLESGKLEVHMFQGDLIDFIQHLLESFQSLLENKNIRLDVKSSVPELLMDYDPEKITTILSNLLSNAVKYTPASGTVEVRIDQEEEQVKIEITDSGKGIPEEELPMIFDRFFRASSGSEEAGSGVGLALTKELVELLEGTIQVESKVGEGTTFTIVLPIKQEAALIPQEKLNNMAFTSLSSVSTPLQPLAESAALSDRPSLLIVEDNIDIAHYLQACLEGDYLIHLAWDGQEGIDFAIENVPDIIISDVMMPNKNGYELCDTLKNDRRTSHIPIILLTAKADVDSRIEGLETGADAYLAKPFNQKELFVRLNKLLEVRKKMQEFYSAPENLPASQEEADNQENSFLWEVRKAIEDNLDDERFGIPELCRAVGASRTQLHRKIKALTDQSTSIFVRSIRLNKAKSILLSTDLNITQVAFEVGFNDPKYFSTKFQEMFGQSPSDFRK